MKPAFLVWGEEQVGLRVSFWIVVELVILGVRIVEAEQERSSSEQDMGITDVALSRLVSDVCVENWSALHWSLLAGMRPGGGATIFPPTKVAQVECSLHSKISFDALFLNFPGNFKGKTPKVALICKITIQLAQWFWRVFIHYP